MKIKFYTIRGCAHCSTMEQLCDRAGLPYEKVLVGELSGNNEDGCTISMFDFTAAYPNAKGFPYVILDDEPVGGLVEAAKVFLDKGLVSTKKK
tara:strand:- start:370 stop:648 length:279 start_codon:yes stop_codon:yes gene_type:complete